MGTAGGGASVISDSLFRFGIVFSPKFYKWHYSVCTTFALGQLIFERRLARLFKSKCSDRGVFRFEKFIRIGNVVQPNILEHLNRPNSHHLFQLQFF